MPYRQQWFDASKDMTIPVVPGDEKTPPDGYELQAISVFMVVSVVRQKMGDLLTGRGTDKPYTYYHCHYCQGWIDGVPNEYEVNTLRPEQLAGRQGTEFYCRRCGKEIGFLGMMS